ncbi:mycothiol transferase [Actinomadura litoris]|uniref:mycothiol transferase n=1 Tax=Actinomadura litoris TaxID=2678616 RepID=UPI0027E0584A|nr:DUF664 domain-containing protein [Actinomadura litoris]
MTPWCGRSRGSRNTTFVIAETDRHAGHADIVRELIDGAVGLSVGKDGTASGDKAWWEDYRDRLERVAREAGQH